MCPKCVGWLLMAIAPTQIFNQVRVAKKRADTKYLNRKKFDRTIRFTRGKKTMHKVEKDNVGFLCV